MARRPYVEIETEQAAIRLTKNQWIELYRDLFRQTYGEDTGSDWMADAKQRLRILKQNGVSR